LKKIIANKHIDSEGKKKIVELTKDMHKELMKNPNKTTFDETYKDRINEAENILKLNFFKYGKNYLNRFMNY
jgi:hypothetical protein